MLAKLETYKYRSYIEAFFHFAFWVLFIHLVFDVFGLLHSFEQLFLHGESIIDEAFIFIPLALILFYWNYSYLRKNYLSKGEWIKYCIGVLIGILLIFALSNGLYYLLEKIGFDFKFSFKTFNDHFIQLCMVTTIVSTSLGIAKIAMNNYSRKTEAELKQKEAELKYLANQFNPHFLHNTLNGIYSIAIEEDAPKTKESIVMLSEIMRYPLNQGLKSQVPLQEEIDFIDNYIDLQRLRIGEDYPIEFKKEGNLHDVKILPLSLIILVENSFKFGVSHKTRSHIIFRLKLTDSHLYFTTENQVKNVDNVSTHNIGLKNLEERLQLLYNDKYTLNTRVDKDYFIVEFKLEIT